MIDKMLDRAQRAESNAYALYSHFSVGACIRTENDLLFSGCNVENAAYGLTQCAEASAIGSMVAAGELAIKEVVIVSSGEDFCPPCGACRQRLFEFSSSGTIIYLFNRGGERLQITMDELMPFPFGSKNLGNDK
jgi:cytidine deaminase